MQDFNLESVKVSSDVLPGLSVCENSGFKYFKDGRKLHCLLPELITLSCFEGL